MHGFKKCSRLKRGVLLLGGTFVIFYLAGGGEKPAKAAKTLKKQKAAAMSLRGGPPTSSQQQPQAKNSRADEQRADEVTPYKSTDDADNSADGPPAEEELSGEIDIAMGQVDHAEEEDVEANMSMLQTAVKVTEDSLTFALGKLFGDDDENDSLDEESENESGKSESSSGDVIELNDETLSKITQEVADRLEREIKYDFRQRADQIANEKANEIDHVVTQDEDSEMAAQDFANDVAQVKKVVVEDLREEIDDAAEEVKEQIQTKAERIEEEVVEKVTGKKLSDIKRHREERREKRKEMKRKYLEMKREQRDEQMKERAEEASTKTPPRGKMTSTTAKKVKGDDSDDNNKPTVKETSSSLTGDNGASSAIAEMTMDNGPTPSFNTYYGYLHAHVQKRVSDGTGRPEVAYREARRAGLDFFGLSDNAIYFTEEYWHRFKEKADDANVDGEFVAFRGFEYMSDGHDENRLIHGHLTVTGTPEFCNPNTFTHNKIEQFEEWLDDQAEGIAIFNEPGQYNTAFEHFRFDKTDKIVGMELWNRNDDLYDTRGLSSSDGHSYYDKALMKGWKVGAGGGQDYKGLWGTLNDWRMAVLSTELTRTSILDALKNRRFYSVRDKNLKLSFTFGDDDHPMGSILDVTNDFGSLTFTIEASDPDGHISKVDLIKNGVPIKTWESAANPFQGTYTVNNLTAGDFFYARVFDGSSWKAISSPIFFD